MLELAIKKDLLKTLKYLSNDHVNIPHKELIENYFNTLEDEGSLKEGYFDDQSTSTKN